MIYYALAASIAALLGGALALYRQKWMNLLLGYAAGSLIGVVCFELLPEIFDGINRGDASEIAAMTAFVSGFIFFHILEKSLLIHTFHEDKYSSHHLHANIGAVSVSALIAHSFVDGMGIGLAFQASETIGVAVAIAIIAHRFTDGMNVVNLMLMYKNSRARTKLFLGLAVLSPFLGAISTLLFNVPESYLILYLGFFAGALFYIASSEILPEAHSEKPSYLTILYTLIGIFTMYAVTQLV